MKIALKPPVAKPNPSNTDLEREAIAAIIAASDLYSSSPIRIADDGVYLRYGDRIYQFRIDINLVGEVNACPIRFDREE